MIQDKCNQPKFYEQKSFSMQSFSSYFILNIWYGLYFIHFYIDLCSSGNDIISLRCTFEIKVELQMHLVRGKRLVRTIFCIYVLSLTPKLHVTLKCNFNFFSCRSKFMKQVSIVKPDLIHIRSRWPAFCFSALVKKLQIPLVTTYHGTYSGNSFFLKRKYFFNHF